MKFLELASEVKWQMSLRELYISLMRTLAQFHDSYENTSTLLSKWDEQVKWKKD